MDISMIVLAAVICTLFGYLAGVFTMDMFQKAAQKRGQALISAAGGKVAAPPMPEAKGGSQTRLCVYDDHLATWHCFTDSGSAIIEDSDGNIKTVEPSALRMIRTRKDAPLRTLEDKMRNSESGKVWFLQNRELYLLSFDTLRQAEVVAGEMGLARGEYVHIPYWTNREQVLAGRSVSDEKYLVGAFTERERRYLLRSQSTKGEQ